MAPVLERADALLDQGHLYKTGGSASVGKVDVNGRSLLIKRYNIKNFAHWLKRFWRPRCTWHAGREGHRLTLLGIATTKTLELLAKRFLWLRRGDRKSVVSGKSVYARFEIGVCRIIYK